MAHERILIVLAVLHQTSAYHCPLRHHTPWRTVPPLAAVQLQQLQTTAPEANLIDRAWQVANLDNGLLNLGVSRPVAKRRRNLIRARRIFKEENECAIGSLERRCLAEAVGTAFIVAVTSAAASCISGLGPFALALVTGLTVGSAVLAFAGVSGAHFNPAITLALLAGKKFQRNNVPAYLASQFAGATLASAAAFALTSGSSVPLPSPAAPFAAEAAAASILVFSCFAIGDAVEVGRIEKGALPILVGLLIASLCLAFGPLGAGINPVMSLAPRLVAALAGCGSAALTGAWSYAAGPCAGALLGGSFFSFLVGRGEGLYRASARMGQVAAQNRAEIYRFSGGPLNSGRRGVIVPTRLPPRRDGAVRGSGVSSEREYTDNAGSGHSVKGFGPQQTP